MGKRPRGPERDWQPRGVFNIALLADVLDRMTQHQADGTVPRSPRGLFYDLRPSGFGRGITYTKYPAKRCVRGDHLVPAGAKNCPLHRLPSGKPGQLRKANLMDASPADVQEILTHARRAGKVNENDIEDTRAPLPSVPQYDDETAETIAAQLADMVRNPSLYYSPQENQPVYLEVHAEAAGLIGRLERVAHEYGVPVYSGGGYDGIKAKRLLAQRAAHREVPTVVLRVTDYDDHGLVISSSSMEDSQAWAEQHYGAEQDWLTVDRIALTEQQAIDHDLLDQFGKAEADGLPVPVQDAILREAIERWQPDDSIRQETIERADAERERVPDLVRELLEQS